MGKLLFWLVVLFGIGLYLYAAFKLKRRRAQPSLRSAPVHTHQTVRCAHCGAFVAQQQAVQRNGQWFCSWEHAAAEPAAPPSQNSRPR